MAAILMYPNYKFTFLIYKHGSFDVRRIFEDLHVSFKNIKFPRGNYQTVSPETETLFTAKFSLELKSLKLVFGIHSSSILQHKNAMKTTCLLLNSNNEKLFSRKNTSHPGIFAGWTPLACVQPPLPRD